MQTAQWQGKHAMSGRFTDQLRRALDSVWEAQHQHPFVRGLGDGSLPEERFKVWLGQDYLFLIEYARLFTLGAARAPDLDTLTWMIDMAHGILHSEMVLHRAYAVEFGLEHAELESGVKLPSNRAYTDHLLRTASLGGYLDLVAALLPCVWGDAEIGQRLAGRAGEPGRYARWVEMYSSPLAANLAARGRGLLDRLSDGASERTRRAAAETFATSSRYEWLFWEMCYKGESWPV
jgi:thiaminase/transcriptional activator TenA